MRVYTNHVYDLTDKFYVAFNISVILREFNLQRIP
jgi:hypothetical protein